MGVVRPFSKGYALIVGSEIVLKATQYRYKDLYAGILGARWDKLHGVWRYPLSVFTASALANTLGIECLSDELKMMLDIYQREESPQAVDSKTPLWKHQYDCYQFCYNLTGAMIAMDMGVGKSKVAVDLICNHHSRRVLVIGPLSVLPVWPLEFAKHGAMAYNVTVLDYGDVKKEAKVAAERLKMDVPTVVVVNYEAAWREPLRKVLLDCKWDYVVADESHRCKAPGGKASMFMAKLRDRSARRLALSGTPLGHSILDAYGQYRFLDPGVFGTSYTRFRSRYAVMGGFNGFQMTGVQNEQEFNRKFYSIGFRVKADDVLDLPSSVEEIRYCKLNAETMRVYHELEDDFYARVGTGEITVSNALVKLLRLQQLTGGYLLTDDKQVVEMDDSKYRVLKEILEDIPQDEPVVVFCRFLHDLDQVKKLYTERENPRTVAELSGRRKELAEWQRGEFNVLAAQIQAGSEGNDFTRARYQIYFSVGYSLTNYSQSLRRILRPGQERNVVYIHIIAKGTVDTKVYKALRDRKEIIEYVLGLKGDVNE
jgi:SNF2 family DNA or RNA helicase